MNLIFKIKRILGIVDEDQTADQLFAPVSRDFSDIEDSHDAYKIISELGAIAGKTAAAEAEAIGLAKVFVKHNQIIRVYPDGHEEVVVAQPPRGGKYYYSYKASTVLHAFSS